MTNTTIMPVRREVTVPTTPDRAFQIFTTHFDTWWPRAHHIGGTALARAVLEPRVGGRWYEVGTDGSECEWGTVLAWEEPSRLVVTWQLNGRFEYDPDPARASEIEVTFHAVDERSTLVSLEHRYLERMVAADEARDAIGGDEGWRGILKGFVVLVEASSR